MFGNVSSSYTLLISIKARNIIFYGLSSKSQENPQPPLEVIVGFLDFLYLISVDSYQALVNSEYPDLTKIDRFPLSKNHFHPAGVFCPP